LDKLKAVETKETKDILTGEKFDEDAEMPGLGRWVKRNAWFLVRLFMVLVFTFGTTLIAEQFSYGLQEEAVEFSVSEINDGQLPAGVRNGDYVRITGTADVGDEITAETLGGPESEVAFVLRYQVPYFYFRLDETGNNLLVQSANNVPNFEEIDGEETVWEGKLSNLGTVIFFSSTREALEVANLPTDQSIPVIETGDTPEAYRNLFPAYSSVIIVWVASLIWLLWKRNTPFM
jgi:hypothetical protein